MLQECTVLKMSSRQYMDRHTERGKYWILAFSLFVYIKVAKSNMRIILYLSQTACINDCLILKNEFLTRYIVELWL